MSARALRPVTAACLAVLLCRTQSFAMPRNDPTNDQVANDSANYRGKTYKNADVGVELTVPDELEFRPTESIHLDGAERLIISADSKPHNRFAPRKYIVDEEVKLIPDPLAAHHGEDRTADGYFAFASRSIRSTGSKPSDRPTTGILGEVQLTRANFVQGKRRYTLLVAVHNGYGFAFVIATNDADTAERLIKGTVLKYVP